MGLVELLGFSSSGWGGLLLLGVLITLSVTVVALLVGAVFGALIAAAKLSNNWFAQVLGHIYTTVFRGVPELLIIYLIYFGGSSVITAIGQQFGIEGFLGLPPFAAGALAVGMICGAYQAEVYRGAFLAIPKGELEAAQAIGMHRWLRFRRIIVPQIIRSAIPGLGNVWQLSLKDSALVSVTGLADLMRTSQVAAGSTRQYLLFFIVGGCLYLALTFVSDRLFTGAERRANRSLAPSIGQA
jgi:octopine/nopaline transport system permease protein